MIHIFIVSEDRETLRELQIMEQKAESERKIAEQIAISNTDEMTGIFNRRAYEEDLKNHSDEVKNLQKKVRIRDEKIEDLQYNLDNANDEIDELEDKISKLEEALNYFKELWRKFI